MKKTIIFGLILALLLASCAPKTVNQPLVLEDDEVVDNVEDIENNLDEIEEDLDTVEEEVIAPLFVSLEASEKSAELLLHTDLKCDISGGKEPFTMEWEGVECLSEKCDTYFRELGEYLVTCTVTDAAGQTDSDTIKLTVMKEKRKVYDIITLGDSLTYGHGLEDPATQNWAALYSKNFLDTNLHNYAISGATVFNVKTEQLDALKKDAVYSNKDYKLIFVWVGANDIKNFILPGEYQVAYEEVVAEIKKIPNAEIILMTVPDVSKLSVADDIEADVNSWLEESGIGIQINVKQITSDTVVSYNNVIEYIAQTQDLQLIDMFAYHQDIDDSYITEDRFHPNEEGQKLVEKKVRDDVASYFPKADLV